MRGVNTGDGYLEALVKNMPSETVAGHLAVQGMLSGAEAPPTWALWLFWGIFLVATPFYLWLLTPANEPKRPWYQIFLFSPIAFLIWSMTMPGPFQSYDSVPMIGGVLIIVFSALVFPLASMGFSKLGNGR